MIQLLDLNGVAQSESHTIVLVTSCSLSASCLVPFIVNLKKLTNRQALVYFTILLL